MATATNGGYRHFGLKACDRDTNRPRHAAIELFDSGE
jgi:hypothetical protein